MRKLTTKKMSQSGLIIILSLLSVLFLFSCEETTGPGEVTPNVTSKLLIYSDKDSIPANGGSAQILVKVYAEDDTTDVVSGAKVIFTANQAGTKLAIPVKNDLTDANGYARATLYAGSRAGSLSAVRALIASSSDAVSTGRSSRSRGAGSASGQSSTDRDGSGAGSVTAGAGWEASRLRATTPLRRAAKPACG